ncbi:MBL fold metallo-hydrolase [Methanocella sp. CWC-04]|uniref:MBL fold metallo-hydrolase n=1 Tax=Methanooceanicella nereidis TaxID=2052831 RepID=A0AAP2R9M5_9EURY|nr:MBL fold metallo-hydrolase [Methanocella sp. CWC-04]MCD1293464.1 MBL fold metallo-hydrolase [Methanocella sp. CWC-04]
MFLKQFFVEGLGQSSYMLGTDGICAIIDPERDIDEYLRAAKTNGFKIAHIFETHLHADFVSGHIDLSRKTGAKIYAPASANVKYDHVPLKEGDVVSMGALDIKVIESPGHTPEMINLIVSDKERSDDPYIVFTGDTLFVGDVGRPDLFGEEMANKLTWSLYDSLYNKLGKLPDWAEIYPAHGAGSLCGKNIGSKRWSTIGYEKRNNPAMMHGSFEEFKHFILEDMPEAPSYFFRTSEVNREGPKPLDTLPGKKPLSPGEVEELIAAGAVVLDTRSIDAFAGSHIKGAINIGIAPAFSTWAGNFIPYDKPVVLVLEQKEELDKVVKMLIRVGLDNIAGYLGGGMTAWHDKGMEESRFDLLTVDMLKTELMEKGGLKVVDVRTPAEWDSGHIKDAIHLQIMSIEKNLDKLDKDENYAVVCGSGYRGSIAASILAGKGFGKMSNVAGGMRAWKAKGYPTV